MSFDQSIFEALYALAGKSQLLDFAGIFFASYLPYLLLVLFFVFLLRERRWKVRFYNFVFVALAVILSRGLFAEIIRFFYYRPRPPVILSIEPLIDLSSSGSFPSGHATIFFALAGAMFLLNRRWGLWFFGGAILIGIARIFVGVHWPLDIVGGLVVGFLSAGIVKLLLRRTGAEPSEFKEISAAKS